MMHDLEMVTDDGLSLVDRGMAERHSFSHSIPHPVSTHMPSSKDWNLSSRVYLVTGGTKGIGLAVVQSILAHDADSVLLCARGDGTETLTLLQSQYPHKSNQIHYCSCDISTKSGRDTLVNTATTLFGDKLDGLVNNVGVNIRKNITNQTEDEYENIMKVNVDSTYFLCKLFKPMLMNAAKERGSASVINVASAAGIQSSGTGSAYGMSKAAVIHLSKTLACEWAANNIRVNAVAPWMTMTPMLEEAIKSDPTQLDKVQSWTPMHRLATVQDIANPVIFLLMPCSSYITGQCIAVDGGLTAQGFSGPCCD
jgi:Tropinone reductase 1